MSHSSPLRSATSSALIDARIAQLEEGGDTSGSAAPTAEEAPVEAVADEADEVAPVEAVADEADEVEEPESEAAPAEDIAAEATHEPEASDEAPAAEGAENADPGTEEE